MRSLVVAASGAAARNGGTVAAGSSADVETAAAQIATTVQATGMVLARLRAVSNGLLARCRYTHKGNEQHQPPGSSLSSSKPQPRGRIRCRHRPRITYLGLLALDGALVNIGLSGQSLSIAPFSLITNGPSIAGSRIGSIAETQDMLGFCGEHGIGAQVEVIDADRIDEAYNRVVTGDVCFRFVIEISTMA
jgi:hypothetical protein